MSDGKLEALESIDRGHDIGDDKKKKSKSKLVGLVILLVAFLLLFVAYRLTAGSHSTEADSVTSPIENTSNVTDHQYDNNKSSNFFDQAKQRFAQRKIEEKEANRLREEANSAPPRPALVTEPITPPEPQPQPQPQRVVNTVHQEPTRTIESRRLSGSVTIAIDGQQNSSASVSSNQSPFGIGKNTKSNTEYDVSEFDSGVAAYRNERDFLLIHGTSIPCILKTEIISDYNGIVQCMIPEDIYSANGATLLLERGSMLQGTQNVAVEAGKSRVFTVWHDIETPTGVSVVINSLGVGALGASGSEAWIDNHYGQRFGAAIMLSFIDDALATVAANAQHQSDKTGVEISTSNSSDNASEMASIALENSINIKPTAYVPIGTKLNVILARDIDMSSVYSWN